MVHQTCAKAMNACWASSNPPTLEGGCPFCFSRRAEIIILSVPDSLLVGASNEKLVRHVRTLNSTAKIVATADFLANVGDLYVAGADYVTVTRLSDAHELYTVIEATDAGLLQDKRADVDALLAERREVLP